MAPLRLKPFALALMGALCLEGVGAGRAVATEGLTSARPKPYRPTTRLLAAMRQVESSGNDRLVWSASHAGRVVGWYAALHGARTAEQIARVWNGSPAGARKPQTAGY